MPDATDADGAKEKMLEAMDYYEKSEAVNSFLLAVNSFLLGGEASGNGADGYGVKGACALGNVAPLGNECGEPFHERPFSFVFGGIPPVERVEIEFAPGFHYRCDVAIDDGLHPVEPPVVLDGLGTFHGMALVCPLVAVQFHSRGNPFPASSIENFDLHESLFLSACGFLSVEHEPRRCYTNHISSFFKNGIMQWYHKRNKAVQKGTKRR